MPKPPRPSASEVLRHNLLILVGLPLRINTVREALLLGPYSATWAVFRAEDRPEVFRIFTSRLYFRFCAFIVRFRAYVVRILSIHAALSR